MLYQFQKAQDDSKLITKQVLEDHQIATPEIHSLLSNHHPTKRQNFETL